MMCWKEGRGLPRCEDVFPRGLALKLAESERRRAMGAVVNGVGKDAAVVVNEKGGKQSACQHRCDLLPPLGILAVAQVLKHGADKYGANNWHAIPTGDHVNHALIHLFAFLAGDGQDDHLEHAACRILMALDQHKSGRDGA